MCWPGIKCGWHFNTHTWDILSNNGKPQQWHLGTKLKTCPSQKKKTRKKETIENSPVHWNALTMLGCTPKVIKSIAV